MAAVGRRINYLWQRLAGGCNQLWQRLAGGRNQLWQRLAGGCNQLLPQLEEGLCHKTVLGIWDLLARNQAAYKRQEAIVEDHTCLPNKPCGLCGR